MFRKQKAYILSLIFVLLSSFIGSSAFVSAQQQGSVKNDVALVFTSKQKVSLVAPVKQGTVELQDAEVSLQAKSSAIQSTQDAYALSQETSAAHNISVAETPTHTSLAVAPINESREVAVQTNPLVNAFTFSSAPSASTFNFPAAESFSHKIISFVQGSSVMAQAASTATAAHANINLSVLNVWRC